MNVSDVSVVVPFYNRSFFFERLYKSLINQSVRPDTIYIVDNGSDYSEIEKCIFILDKYKSNEIDVVFVSTTKRGNANYARNLGCFLAKTRYVAFLDSDDWWEKKHLENSLMMINKSKKAGVYSGARVHNNGVKLYNSFDVNQLENPFSLLFSKKNYIAQSSSYVIDKNAIDGRVSWDERLKRHQDYDFFLSLHYNTVGWCFYSPATSNIDWQDGGTKTNLDYRSMIRFLKKWDSYFPLKEMSIYLNMQVLSCIYNPTHEMYGRYYKRLMLVKVGKIAFFSMVMHSFYIVLKRFVRGLIKD